METEVASGPMRRATQRLEWLDAARGIGIIAVVAGHVFSGRLHGPLYLFHIPLFFVLSGFVLRPSDDPEHYAARRAKQLLVPYAAWLLLLAIGPLMRAIIQGQRHDALVLAKSLVFGGSRLQGWFGVFWFVTALYAALILYDRLQRFRSVDWIIAGFYALAMASTLLIGRVSFPEGIDAALFALPFIHIGALARRYEWHERTAWLVGGALLFLFATALQASGAPVPTMDVKYGIYGLPLVSALISLGGIALVVLVVRNAAKLNPVLAYIGRASLLIMFTHCLLHIEVDRHLTPNESVRFLIALGVPLTLYPLMRRSPLLRSVFLGESLQTLSRT